MTTPDDLGPVDTAKGADPGGSPDSLVIDLNFLSHPSCRYDSAWLRSTAPTIRLSFSGKAQKG